ncbi:MAG: hypothetical protein HY762_00345 [Planctomycetes bacterium]|nr:hypothetical protein [Planctomycetota bacterium]
MNRKLATVVMAGVLMVTGLLIKAEPPVDVADLSAEARRAKVDDLMKKGVDQIVGKDYQNAVKTFHEVIGLLKEENQTKATAYYNLACSYALLKETKPALEYLGKAIKTGYDDRKFIEADPDLISLRGLPEYKALLDKIAPIAAVESTPDDDEAHKEAVAEIEKVRGLKFTANPQYKIMAADQLRRLLRRDVEHIQGVYVYADKTLYIKQGIEPVRFKGTRIHETFHALQDQLFNLEKLNKMVNTTDGSYALEALIEGDATLTFIECMPGTMASRMLESATPWRMMGGEAVYDASAQGEAAKRAGAFGYSIAARFVKAIKEAEDWDGVNALYTSLPASTEQVLHPDKYLAGEQPVKVTIPDLTGVLGAGWKAGEPDTQGEFVMTLQLLTNPKSGPLADEAAAGWGGDTVIEYRNITTTQSFYIHKSVWDTAEDADQYHKALKALPAEKDAHRVTLLKDSTVVEIRIYKVGDDVVDKVLKIIDGNHEGTK